ncbi:cytochrome P450 [Cytidiella melzeri]|nr:cytochrome P450 [Cytidiella melzeri]
MSSISTRIVCGAVLGACMLRYIYKRSNNSSPLPPGPPSDPIIGHLRIKPDSNSAPEAFHEWSLKYGEIMSFQVLGKTIIVLNSERAASEILDKRSIQNSDRAAVPLVQCYGGATLFLQYDRKLIQHRKLLHLGLSKEIVPSYQHIMARESVVLLKGLLDNPKMFDMALQRYSTGVITTVTYGHRIRSYNDEYFKTAAEFGKEMHAVTRPSLLDISLHFAKLPSWLPGAWFINYIERITPIFKKLYEDPYRNTQESASTGTLQASFFSEQLDDLMRKGGNDEQLLDLKLVCSQMFIGATDTTWHTLVMFIVAVMLNPEVQSKAQAEIDSVVGRDRLPGFEDRDALPYVQCVVHETMRWQPVVPLGIPHMSTADDCYEDMLIPKGSTIIANTRGMTWNAHNFHEPLLYKPERFLPKPDGGGETFPMNAVFGWGRRICPGRHLAERSLWLGIARMLSVFNITKAKDAGGAFVDTNLTFVTGLTRHPLPFLCEIRPRDEQAVLVTQQSYLDAETS